VFLWKRVFKLQSKAIILLKLNTTEYKPHMLLLGMLLSSLFVFNTIGSNNDLELNTISSAISLIKRRVRDIQLPSLIWILRGTELYNDSKRHIKELIEANCKSKEIKDCFSDYDCIVLNQSLEHTLAPFVEEEIMRIKMVLRCKVKTVKNYTNGQILCSLIKVYIERYFESIKTSSDYLSKEPQSFELVRKIEDYYMQLANNKIFHKLPLNREEIKETLKHIKAECITIFKDKHLIIYIKKLKQEVKQQVKQIHKAMLQNYFNEHTKALDISTSFDHFKNKLNNIILNVPKALLNSAEDAEITYNSYSEVIWKFVENKCNNRECNKLVVAISNLHKRNTELSEEIIRLTQKSDGEISQLRTQLVECETQLDKYRAELDVKKFKIAAQGKELKQFKDLTSKQDQDISILAKKVESYEMLIKVQKEMLAKALSEVTQTEQQSLGLCEKENKVLQRKLSNKEELVKENRMCMKKSKSDFVASLYETNKVKCRDCGEYYAVDIFVAHKKLCIHKQDSDSSYLPQSKSNSLVKVFVYIRE